MAERGNRRGCRKVGCLGCVAVLGVGILVVVVLVALASASRVEPRIEDVDRSRMVGPPLPGRVILDVSSVDFEVRPGPPGGAIRVEGRYDAARYELDERLDSEGETGWSYRLTFRRRGIAGLTDDHDNRLVLFLPAGTPIALEGHIGLGASHLLRPFDESSLELGGLHLTEAVLDLGMGVHRMSFTEPLSAPMGRLRVTSVWGMLTLVTVGNASPEVVELSHRIGELHVDLRGAWIRDASIDLRCGLGVCAVSVPREVELDLEHASVTLGTKSRPAPEIRSPGEGRPTLHLSVTGRIGEVRVER